MFSSDFLVSNKCKAIAVASFRNPSAQFFKAYVVF